MLRGPICLVGMSGVGKSHLSAALAREGWRRHDCDGAIADALEGLEGLALPSAGEDGCEEPVHALGRWMGMPWSQGYAERERRYLALEERVTAEALREASSDAARGHGRQVIDTTGSVIYLSEALREGLRASSEILYLRTALEDYGRMLELYLREPKPVVWGGLFEARGHGPESLAEAYAALLEERDRRYLALAHRWLWARELRRAEERGEPRDAALARACPTAE